MSWLVDNAVNLYILCAIAAAGCVAAWRFTARVKYLGFALGIAFLAGVLLILTRVYETDSKRLEYNVLAMRDAVVAGKPDDLFKHISADFNYRGVTRDMLYQQARANVEARRVKDVQILHFNVEEVSRAKKFARTRFRVTASAERDYPFITEADFVLEGEQWKLKTVRFYDPVQSAREIDVILNR